MYRWQTLTLARLELTARRVQCSAAFLDAAKTALIRIGVPHFPEPQVNWHPRHAGDPAAVSLEWEVDGRGLSIVVTDLRDGPALDARVGTPCGVASRSIDLGAADDGIHDAVHHLLFGYGPPVEPAPAPPNVPVGEAPVEAADRTAGRWADLGGKVAEPIRARPR